MGDLGDRLEVADLQRRVGARLAEDGAGVLVDCGGEVGRVLGVDEGAVDAHGREDVGEHGVGAAVQVAGRDDVVAHLGAVDDGVEARRGAGRKSDATHGRGALEHADALLDDVGGRVHEAGVDVPELREREEVRRMLGVVELVRRGAAAKNATSGNPQLVCPETVGGARARGRGAGRGGSAQSRAK